MRTRASVACVAVLVVAGCGSGHKDSSTTASTATNDVPVPVSVEKASYLARARPLCARLRLLPERIAREKRIGTFRAFRQEAVIKAPVAAQLAALRPPVGDGAVVARLNSLILARLMTMERFATTDPSLSTLDARRQASVSDFDRVTELDGSINRVSRSYGLPPCAPGP
jgi:hypothetical protein